MEVTVSNIWPIIPKLNYYSEHHTFILMLLMADISSTLRYQTKPVSIRRLYKTLLNDISMTEPYVV